MRRKLPRAWILVKSLPFSANLARHETDSVGPRSNSHLGRRRMRRLVVLVRRCSAERIGAHARSHGHPVRHANAKRNGFPRSRKSCAIRTPTTITFNEPGLETEIRKKTQQGRRSDHERRSREGEVGEPHAGRRRLHRSVRVSAAEGHEGFIFGEGKPRRPFAARRVASASSCCARRATT